MNTSKAAGAPVAKGAGGLKSENFIKGTIFSLGAIVAGVVLWVVIWRLGFIASIAAFAIAWLAIKLYGLGAGAVTRKSVPIIIAVSVVGVCLAFLSTMVSDALDFVVEESGLGHLELLTDANFWSFFGENLSNAELWSSYKGDIIMSVVFAALGMFWTLKDLFISTKPKAVETSK